MVNKLLKCDQSNEKFVIIVSVLIVIALYFFAIAVDKHLSADGVSFFVRVIDNHRVNVPDEARIHAFYLTQFLLVIAVKLGVTNVDMLSKVYGVNIFIPWLLSFLIAFFALRGNRKDVLIIMAISIISINFVSNYALFAEHQVLSILSWPILLLIARNQELNKYDATLLYMLLICCSRIYPASIMLYLLFLVLSLYRAVKDNVLKQKIIFVISALLSIIFFFTSLYHIINPKHVENRGSFYNAIFDSFTTPETLSGSIFMLLFILGWCFNKKILVLLSSLPIFTFLCYSLHYHYHITAEKSFGSRALTMTILPILLFTAYKIIKHDVLITNNIKVVFIFYITVTSLTNAYSTLKWKEFRDDMKLLLKEDNGVLQIENTKLIDSPQRWAWNNKLLSVVWSDGYVKTVLTNPQGIKWEPKAPPEYLILSDYRRYTEKTSNGRI